jgi:A/G-specific adenine glycosylase
MIGLLDDGRACSRFRARLLRWYDDNKRQLPWRDKDDSYHVWVSEIMLQQTRVDQMGPYYERFIRRFPTVRALADAAEADVLKAWEGLGYYSRARNLHRAARILVDDGDGSLPREHDELLRLPGIGSYTAAAISSIAFDAPHPVLDGNVTRVLCRLLRIEEEPRTAAARTELIAAGERLLARKRPGDFNQALMELGARVCKPARADCDNCPVKAFCRARSELADPAQLPAKSRRKPRPHFEVTAGMIWKRGGWLLIAQRPADGMLGGLWEFPGGKQEKGESLAACLRREIREELDFDIEVGVHLAQVDHAYSHFSITLHAFEAHYLSGRPRPVGCADLKWIRPSQLQDYAMPRADRRILENLADSGEQEPLSMSYTERKIRGC